MGTDSDQFPQKTLFVSCHFGRQDNLYSTSNGGVVFEVLLKNWRHSFWFPFKAIS